MHRLSGPMMRATKRALVGRAIIDADFRPFKNGRGGTAHDPVLTLDNGRRLSMTAEETDVGEYGVSLQLSSSDKPGRH